MPSVTFDGQSFSVKGRRIWLAACEFDYSLVPADAWRERLLAAVQAGFNTIVASAPWSLHEPRQDRFRFDGSLDVAHFAELCSELNLWLVLRIGPVVGGTYDGGGLPAWLSDLPGIRLRQPNPVYFDRVTRWFRAIADRVVSLQTSERGAPLAASAGKPRETGPIVAVQLEDDWECGGTHRAHEYFVELVRFAREVGFAVPLLTANQSWASVDAATDTWSGWDDLSATVRQLAHLEPERPRLVTVRDPASDAFLGARATPRASGHDHLMRLACVLAAGGQFVVGNAFTVTHRGATAGRGTDGFFATTARDGAMFDSSGRPREGHAAIRRIASFASSFGHVLAQADIEQQAVVVEPEHAPGITAIPLTGPGGTAVFVFGGEASRAAATVPLLLKDGRRMDAHVGGAPVAWFLLDVDLLGAGVLDHASISPHAFLDRRFLVFVGPVGIAAHVSIDGTPLTMRVPLQTAGAKLAVERRRELIVVVCNETQFDGLRLVNGELHCDVGGTRTRVARDGSMTKIAASVVRLDSAGAVRTIPWSTIVSAQEFVDGTSQRFASIGGPKSLAACDANDGCGWYRVAFRRAAAGTVSLFAPSLGDRASVWLDGVPVGCFGADGQRFPAALKMAAGEHRLVLFVERLGRPTAGDHVARRSGLFGPLFDVAPIKTISKREHRIAADPFALRGFVYGVSQGDVGAGEALAWKLTLKKRVPLVIDAGPAPLAGTLLVNGTAAARIAADGTEDLAIVIDPAHLPALTQGPNVVQLVFDGDPAEAAITAASNSIRFFEADQLDGTAYAFARWACPEGAPASAKPVKGTPSWLRGAVTLKDAAVDRWLDVSGFAEGVAFVNGTTIGRFAVRDRSRKPLRANESLFVPKQILRSGTNELVVFDLLGMSPKSSVLSTRSDARSS